MLTISPADTPFDCDEGILARVVEAIAGPGYIVLDDVFPASTLNALCEHYHSLELAAFKPAGVGRELAFQIDQQVRRDQIFWLDGEDAQTAGYFRWIEKLRLHINRALFLGLFDYECHYAYYPQGGFYKRHVDAFKGSSNRRLSSVLYLNPHWQTGDGGELLMYRDEETEPFEIIQPLFGRMVIFLSEVFPHEVAPTVKQRFSLTGWYRINANTTENLDPAS